MDGRLFLKSCLFQYLFEKKPKNRKKPNAIFSSQTKSKEAKIEKFGSFNAKLATLRVTMTTTLDTSCSENTMVLSARRGFLHACIF
jgi:hypothetical protein